MTRFVLRRGFLYDLFMQTDRIPYQPKLIPMVVFLILLICICLIMV